MFDFLNEISEAFHNAGAATEKYLSPKFSNFILNQVISLQCDCFIPKPISPGTEVSYWQGRLKIGEL